MRDTDTDSGNAAQRLTTAANTRACTCRNQSHPTRAIAVHALLGCHVRGGTTLVHDEICMPVKQDAPNPVMTTLCPLPEGPFPLRTRCVILVARGVIRLPLRCFRMV